MENCKHSDVSSIHDSDTGAHVIVCHSCKTVPHVCFAPVYDHIEKGFEDLRGWGVFFSKNAVKSAAQGAAIQQRMEVIFRQFREAMLMARIEKNTTLERVAQVLEENGQKDAAVFVRNLKLEVAVGDGEEGHQAGG